MSARNLITIGQVFGRLTVISEAPKRGKHRYFLCQCICGSLPVERNHNRLNRGLVKSCGCLRTENAAVSGVQAAKVNTTHGGSNTSEYKIWLGMWARCNNKNNNNYQAYKDRAPPAVWKNFRVFLNDMGPRPTLKHSIERKDNALPYGPDNCVWATTKEQARNKSNAVNIEYQGRVKCIAEWAEELGMKYNVLYQRLFAYKWTVEKAFTTGVNR